MQESIILRVIGFIKNNRFHLFCLETDIAVVADSLAEAKQKMSDAVTVYFKSFSDEELAAKAYIRKAPLRYRILFNRVKYVRKFIRLFKNLSSYTANYDKNTEHLRFA